MGQRQSTLRHKSQVLKQLRKAMWITLLEVDHLHNELGHATVIISPCFSSLLHFRQCQQIANTTCKLRY
jgi:phenylalanine-4-hydroxylase